MKRFDRESSARVSVNRSVHMAGILHFSTGEFGAPNVNAQPRALPARTVNVLPLLVAAATGASVMYLMDPARGRRRRRLVADKVRHMAHIAGDTAAVTARDLANHARGLAAAAQRPFAGDDADDSVIHGRVRAELGRIVSHPGSVEVMVDQGCVVLSGPVLSDEVSSLLSGVAKVRGVRDVEDRLERHETAESVPGLQGFVRGPARRFELQQENWTPAARLLTVVAGGLMVARSLRDEDGSKPLNAAFGIAGFALMTRAAMTCRSIV